MMVPIIAGGKFFWNLSGNVGTASPNRPDDVQLVQLGYVCAAGGPKFAAALRVVFGAVVPGAPYTGQEADPLTLAIRGHQTIRGGVQDGHVSVLTNLAGLTYDGEHTFMMIALNTQMRHRLVGYFPRLDGHPRCPPLVRAAVNAACT